MSVVTEPRLQAASSTMYIREALLYSPSRKRPDYHVDTKCNISSDQASPESDCTASPDSDGATSPDSISPPLSSSPPTSPPHVCYSISPTSKTSGDSPASLALKRRIVEGQTRMHNRFRPYNRRVAPPPLELRFAARSIGHSSFTSLGLEDVILGKEKFIRSLSQMSDDVVRKAYEAKKAFKKCILSRISLTHDELNAMDKQTQLLQAMQGEQIEELSATDEELGSIKGILVGRGIEDLEDDMAVGHAVYADELVALTIADMQLDQMSGLVGFLEQRGLPELEDDDRSSSSDSSDALLDDLVYEDQ